VGETKNFNDSDLGITATRNGLKYAIQFKRQIGLVTRQGVIDTLKEKSNRSCNAAMIITNSHFTKDAMELARLEKCELVDRDALAKWIHDFKKTDATY
jgi:restriction system protein